MNADFVKLILIVLICFSSVVWVTLPISHYFCSNDHNHPVLVFEEPDHYKITLSFAQQLKKKVIIVFGTETCVYCKKLEDTLNDSKVKQEIDKDYLVVHVDGNKRKDLVSKFKVNGYPTCVIIEGNETVVRRVSGFKTVPEFLRFLDGTLPPTPPTPGP